MTKNLAVCSLLLLLSGFSCTKKDDQAAVSSAGAGSAEVLVSVNGTPALTLKDFKQFIAELTAADQQMQLMAQLMPDFEEKVFEGAKYRDVVISEWAKHNNVASREEYKKQKAQAVKAAESMLNQQMFIKENVPSVTDSEVKKYYDDNKTTDPNLLVKKATKTEPAQYRPFEQIKNPLKEHLMARKIEETVAKVLPDYEKKYGIVVNRSYFEQKRKELEDARAQQMKAMEEKNKTAKAPAKELAQHAGTTRKMA